MGDIDSRAQASLPGSIGCQPTTSTICWSSQKITEYYLYKPSVYLSMTVATFGVWLKAYNPKLADSYTYAIAAAAYPYFLDVKVK